jgi:hypothetical protein
MDEITSCGEWPQPLRCALDLTQAELAVCLSGTIKSAVRAVRLTRAL